MLLGPVCLDHLAGHVPAENEDFEDAELGVPDAAALLELNYGFCDGVDFVYSVFVFEFEIYLLSHRLLLRWRSDSAK